MNRARVELGRHLFYDRRLSADQSTSCATCHQQAIAFSDPRPHPVGITGQVHPRSSMSLANVAYSPVLTWANLKMERLEQQALVPMFGEDPVEMGLAGREQELLARLTAEPRYRALFPAAFPGERTPVTLQNLTKAIAAFERTLISGDSPYDRARHGNPAALSQAARRGEQLFLSERLECFHCHGGFNLTGSVDHAGKANPEIEFHNTGLYNTDGKGAYPAPNIGLMASTGDSADMGSFKAPTLRNVAVTAPYMHDGSIATLDEVVAHYMAGGRTIAEGPNAGVGSRSPLKSAFVPGFTLTPDERRDLVAFLESLTDSTFLIDSRFSDPWPKTVVGLR
jgi:cytochrome c peroxidase